MTTIAVTNRTRVRDLPLRPAAAPSRGSVRRSTDDRQGPDVMAIVASVQYVPGCAYAGISKRNNAGVTA